MSGVKKVVFFSVFPNTPETIIEEMVEIVETDQGPTKGQKMVKQFKHKANEFKMTLKRVGAAVKKLAKKPFRSSTSSSSNRETIVADDVEEQDVEIDCVHKKRTVFEGESSNDNPGVKNLEHYKRHGLFIEQREPKNFKEAMKTTVSNYPRAALTTSHSAETVSSEAGSFATYEPRAANLLLPVEPYIPEQKADFEKCVNESKTKEIAPSSTHADSPMELDNSDNGDAKSTADDELQLGASTSYYNLQQQVDAIPPKEADLQKPTSSKTEIEESVSDTQDHSVGALPSAGEHGPNQEPNLPKDTNGGMSVVFEDGYLYIIGAIVNRISTKCCLRRMVYPEDESDTWEKLPDLPIRCPFHASVADGDEIHVTGGRTTNKSGYTHLDTYYVLSIYRNKWDKTLANTTLPVQKHNAVMFQGQLTIVGGHGVDPQCGVGVLNNVQMEQTVHLGYSTAHHQWNEGPKMHQPRHSCATVALDKHLYAVGGIGSLGEHLHTAERMTLSSKGLCWEVLSNLPAQNPAEHYRRIAFIHKDWVYILGGQPYCLNIKEQKKKEKQPSTSTSDSALKGSILHRQWETPSEIPLPALSLSRRAAAIATIE